MMYYCKPERSGKKISAIIIIFLIAFSTTVIGQTNQDTAEESPIVSNLKKMLGAVKENLKSITVDELADLIESGREPHAPDPFI